MKLRGIPLGAIDWSKLTAAVQPGASGEARARVNQWGESRLRLVEYSAGYLGDHWCHKGHILFVAAGQLVIEHEDGAEYPLSAGDCYHVSDDDGSPHRVRSECGATVFIVD